MFEHLVSHHHNLAHAKKTRVKFYGTLLALSAFILLSAFNISRGSISKASDPINDVVVTIFNNPSSDIYQIANKTQQVVVFDFIVKTNVDKVMLNELNISAQGIDDLAILDGIILYHSQTQLGEIDVVDGNLRIKLGNYKLDKGNNYFYLSWPRANNGISEDTFDFSLEQATSAIVSYQGSLFTPAGDFPINSQTLQIIERGQFSAYNNLPKDNFLAVAKEYSLLADFSLTSNGESASIEKVLVYHDSSIADKQHFYLWQGQEIIADAWSSDDGQLIFELNKTTVVKPDHDLSLQLRASLNLGEYDFILADVWAKGFVSGKQFTLSNSSFLSNILVIDNILQFSDQSIVQQLNNGWQTLFKTHIDSLGDARLLLYKLSWSIDDFAVELEDLELWINDQLYDVNLTQSANKIVATFWQEDLKINKEGIDLVLLAKINKLDSDARLQVNLLTDQQIIAEDNSQNNLLWSINGQMYNSHLLPGLPLAPVILE